jgi:bis(5'-nucleosyl)-tetraphosphatase (symmetrical)
MARYAIGDIQGCMGSLERLLALIAFDPAVDSLWLVGDLVNRGPRSLEVLRWAKAHDAAVTCVLGNHDLHLLARACGVPAKRRDTLDEVLAAPDLEDLVGWLRTRPLVHTCAPWVMVHAGLHPAWTVEQARSLAAEIEAELASQRWRDLVIALEGSTSPWRPELEGLARWSAALGYFVRARTCFSDGRLEPVFDGPPAQAPAGCAPWFELPHARWRTHVPVFGHWAALGLDVQPGHVALDSGCVWGRTLSALRLDDHTVFQVKAVDVSG